GCAPAKKAEPMGGKQVLFYRNPMKPEITSAVPMKDEMGMDYVPVYKKEVGAQAGEISISPEEQKLIGAKTEQVSRRHLYKEIRTVGTVAYDPELYVAQEEYVGTLGLGDEDLIAAGQRRLRGLGLNEEQIARLQKEGKAQENLILPEDKTWVYITIYENETGLVKADTPVEIDTVAFPGETFTGKIAAVSPVLDPMTRSAKARAEIENPGQKLKPGMYANVTIKVALGNSLAVADEAVINTGKRTIVVMAKGNGQYLSRDVRLGRKAEGFYEVLGGLREGDRVVTTGNFLIDSESRLKSTGGGEHQH
ncbi:MAG: efflux RND transporter periplasmic adaptor subunit, partial [Candidatus Margulisbacteria bacterium]|nr:efflux RND transporter periplasmic adaptor subunit [Candidatus Margulisiibacteriota bacterium]